MTDYEKAYDALWRIAYPMAAMQKDAEGKGEKLDGPMAVFLASDADFLRDTAKKALAELPDPN